MAELFLAELEGAKGFRKRVVVKTLRTEHLDDAHQQSMFADEARVGSHIEHAHIPRVLELGEHEGVPFMVQEYVEGPSLEAVLQRQRKLDRVDRRFGVRVVHDVARALDHAYHLHDDRQRPLHVVHRDVSPSNILVARTGQTKLIDFGVARFERRETHTEANLLKGKLRYLAPETLQQAEVSHLTDLYALGVVLYMATTGTAPWRVASDMGRRLRGDFDPPSARVDDFPPSLERIVLRCLSVKPADRFATGGELADQLAAWLQAHGGPVDDAQVARHVDEIFPLGADDWLPTFDPGDVRAAAERSLSGARPRPVRQRRAPMMPWLIALATAAIIAVGGLALTGSVIYLNAQRPPAASPLPAPAAPAAPDPHEALVALAEAADAALQQGDLAEAASQVRAMDDLVLVAPDALARRQQVRDEVAVATAVQSIDAQLAHEPGVAVDRAVELSQDYPGHPAVLAVLERARAASKAQRAAARPRPAPRPAPAPVPTAGPSLLTIEGSPAGAEVVVDGRVVGTVPMQLVVDPGTHDVSLRKEGFVQRREHVEARGDDITVRLDLPQMTDGG